MKSHGFTLIELLIVVAIIAILAAIAVPNFLEAQVRAKNARCKADMRSLATALETYHIDNNYYSTDAGAGQSGIYRPYSGHKTADPPANFTIGYDLTTPIAYITSARMLIDPYKVNMIKHYESTPGLEGREYYFFINVPLREKMNNVHFTTLKRIAGDYVLWAAGPDGSCNNKPGQGEYSQAVYIPRSISYDATNGTVSNGDVYRSQKYSDGMAQDPRLSATD